MKGASVQQLNDYQVNQSIIHNSQTHASEDNRFEDFLERICSEGEFCGEGVGIESFELIEAAEVFDDIVEFFLAPYLHHDNEGARNAKQRAHDRIKKALMAQARTQYERYKEEINTELGA